MKIRKPNFKTSAKLVIAITIVLAVLKITNVWPISWWLVTAFIWVPFFIWVCVLLYALAMWGYYFMKNYKL